MEIPLNARITGMQLHYHCFRTVWLDRHAYCRRIAGVSLFLIGSMLTEARAEDGFELPPIRYSNSDSDDAVSRLKKRIEAGEVHLERDPKYGLLPSLLQALDVPVESQVLVFSKTSLQIHKISPSNPRAIYFNDSVYVGYVPGSDTLELSATDVRLGAVFYTLNSRMEDPNAEEIDRNDPSLGPWKPTIVRDKGQCLSCHATTRTESVPGLLVRSIYADRAGRPRTGSSSYTTDYRSPWAKRWGGWYVTGTHGSMRHLGNIFAIDREDPQKVNLDEGANQQSLPVRVPKGLHPLASSDIVALLVLEHQTRVHNLITRAAYEAVQSTAMDEAMNEALGRPREYRTESTERRLEAAANALVDAITFVDEPPLQATVEGTSTFAQRFALRGPTTQQGRSLRELDLTDRLFRFRLSYLIYTSEFQKLPGEVMERVRGRLRRELGTLSSGPTSNHWSVDEQATLRQIVAETLPGWLE
jgi:hypothetical protein